MIEGDDLVKIGNGELSNKAHQTCTESVKLNLEFVIQWINFKKPKGTGADDIPTSFLRPSIYCELFNAVKGFFYEIS